MLMPIRILNYANTDSDIIIKNIIINLEDTPNPTISFITYNSSYKNISIAFGYEESSLYNFKFNELIENIPKFIELYKAAKNELLKRESKTRKIKRTLKKLKKWESKASDEVKLLLELGY